MFISIVQDAELETENKEYYMCGIIGILKIEESENLINELVLSLKRMAYRGYDSWGYALVNNGELKIEKKTGRIGSGGLQEKTFIGVGHTRWATHGGVTDENAHPHYDCNHSIAVVHNGIIENYLELKKELKEKGHKFTSETDTEVLAHLLEDAEGSNLFEKSKNIAKKLKGAFAVIAIDKNSPNEMIAIKHESPLIIGKKQDSFVIASDPLAFLEYTQDAYFVEEGDIVSLKRNGSIDIQFYNYLSDSLVTRELKKLEWKPESADLKGYPHYMLKEIMEQASALRNGMNKEAAQKIAEFMKGKNVVAVACGTARHAAVIGKHILHKIAKYDLDVMMAHEFSYFIDDLESRSNGASKDTVILAVSQSGETADVLDVVRKAKARGFPVISIVNVTSSTLARESVAIFPLNCGPEIAVASTKAFSNQVMAFYLIAYAMIKQLDSAWISLSRLATTIDKQLPYFDKIARKIAEKIYNKQHIYVLGKGVNFAIALEGSLKIKEISYIHAEGMPSGELKHGALALIEKDTPVILIAPTDYTRVDCISNGLETKARGAFLIGISNVNHPSFDEWISLEELEDPIFYPLLEIAPLQLIAYHAGVLLGRDVDKPRNLAKSVTVK